MTGRGRPDGERDENGVAKNDVSPAGKESTGGINRRRYLALGASAVGSLTFAGTASAAETRRGISFQNVYDVVDDLGFDNSGNSPVDRQIRRHMEDGVLLKFPPGQYLITSQMETWDISNFGIVGTGDDRGDVEFVYPSGYTGQTFELRKGRNWLLENFTLQQTNDRETGSLCQFMPDDNLQIRNVETAGFTPLNVGSGIDLAVRDASGVAVIENYVNRDGGDVGSYPDASPGIFAGPRSNGTIYIRDAHIEEVGSSGVYASRTTGDVRIEGGFFKNNDIASIRVCGEGSYVKDATIVVDTDNTNNVGGTYFNPRGIWWESGHMEKSGGYVENCTFALLSSSSSGGLVIATSKAGELTVRNCRFRNDTRNPTIAAFAPSGVGDGTVDISNVSIVGESYRPYLGAIEIEDRPGSSVTNCCIQGRSKGGNEERDGVVLRDCGTATVSNCTIDVPGKAIILDDTSADPTDISKSGSCPAPTLDGSGSDGYDGGDGSGDSSDSDGGEDGSGDSSDSDGGEDGSGSDGQQSTGELDGATIEIESDGGRATYEFSVSGEIQGNPDAGGADFIRGSTASGNVGGGGQDGYTVTGTVDSFDVDDGATVYLNGQAVSSEEIVGSGGSGGDGSDGSESGSGGGSDSGSTGGDDGSDSGTSGDDGGSDSSGGGSTGELDGATIEIESDGGRATYEFSVSGEIQGNPDAGGADFIRGSTASGNVGGGGQDGYTVSGVIESFNVDGGATVYLNGQAVSPDDLVGGTSGSTDSSGDSSSGDSSTGDSSSGSSTDGESLLVIESDGGRATYEFTVTGDVTRNPEEGGGDRISGRTARGSVGGGGQDGYTVTGEFEAFDVDDGATVYLDGAEVSPAELTGAGAASIGTHSVTLSGTGGGRKFYRLRVSEELLGVGAETVTGHVGRGATAFEYRGEIVDLHVDDADHVDVDLDGETLPPEAI